jgi:antitoxin (DNA-binding transcriptional repressor) of toxin-antitoxin stability system
MKAINVTELKAHLSKYLRRASRGARILVKDRDEPIAELGPPSQEPLSWHERLVREGQLRPGTQEWSTFQVSRLDHPVDIQAALDAVREDPRDTP